MLLCPCGCGGSVKPGNTWINGHNRPFPKGLDNPTQRGENHRLWKGRDVNVDPLHQYIRKHLPRPINNLCEVCHEKIIKEISNISDRYDPETYIRSENNWQRFWRWTCGGPKCNRRGFHGGWNKDKKWSEATRKKMSESQKITIYRHSHDPDTGQFI